MYTITYHHKVVDDIKDLSGGERTVIKTAIEDKLTTEPELFGKPLQFSLKGVRGLRVGDYRVVFQLTKKEVYILLISHRSVVYKNAGNRM